MLNFIRANPGQEQSCSETHKTTDIIWNQCFVRRAYHLECDKLRDIFRNEINSFHSKWKFHCVPRKILYSISFMGGILMCASQFQYRKMFFILILYFSFNLKLFWWFFPSANKLVVGKWDGCSVILTLEISFFINWDISSCFYWSVDEPAASKWDTCVVICTFEFLFLIHFEIFLFALIDLSMNLQNVSEMHAICISIYKFFPH